MKFHTNLAVIARRTGFPVTEVAGWQTRGAGGMADRPQGVVCHHTASGSSTGDMPSLRILTYGRTDLANSLCAYGLARSGHIYVIAAGESWHAGTVNSTAFLNVNAFGIEAENNGIGERWPAVQVEAYVRLCAELCRTFGIPASMVRGHKEVCSPYGRKIDPAGIDMGQFRSVVAARLANPTSNVGETMTPEQQKDLQSRIGQVGMDGMTRHAEVIARITALETAVAADPDNPITQEQLNEAVAKGLAGANITITPKETPA